MQGGMVKSVQQNKEHWEAAQKDLMQIVDESKAKKRKQDASDPPSPERTSNAASTVAGDNNPLLPAVPAAVPPVAPQLPQNQVLPTQGAQTTDAPVEVLTQEARTTTANADKEARLNKLRADAMAKAAVQLAKESGDKPVGATDGMGCTS